MRELYEKGNRKLSAIFCIFAFLLCLAWGSSYHGLTVHAADQTARVKKQVNIYMTAIRKYDINKIKKMQIDKDVFHITYKKIQKHIRMVNKNNLTYEIKRVKLRGQSATVYMHVRQYDCHGDVINALHYTLMDYEKSWSSQKIRKTLYEYLDWAYETNIYPEYFEQDIKLNLVKRGNKWMIPKMSKKMFILKDAGLTDYLDDFTKHPKNYL